MYYENNVLYLIRNSYQDPMREMRGGLRVGCYKLAFHNLRELEGRTLSPVFLEMVSYLSPNAIFRLLLHNTPSIHIFFYPWLTE